MAISPKQVIGPTQKEIDYFSEVEKYIDQTLSSQEGTFMGNGRYSFIVHERGFPKREGIRKEVIKNLIIDRYKQAGWIEVTYDNGGVKREESFYSFIAGL